MAKFLTLWELDTTKLPEKPEEQLALYIEQLNMIKEEFKKKNPHMLDWGLFAGRNQGYSVCEGTEQEIDFALLKYGPYVKFKVYPLSLGRSGIGKFKEAITGLKYSMAIQEFRIALFFF